jgi:hypothetical protein
MKWLVEAEECIFTNQAIQLLQYLYFQLEGHKSNTNCILEIL